MLDEAATTNAAVPPGTSDSARAEAIYRLRDAQTLLGQKQAGDKPPEDGIADDAPTAAGLADALRRMKHHARMIGVGLREMQRGPVTTRWGIAERLSFEDLIEFLEIASQLTFHATVIVMETSWVTPTPATRAEWKKLVQTRMFGGEYRLDKHMPDR